MPCRDVFSAGASHYGVADLEMLAKETHKFESRYLDGLIGPYPKMKDVYVQRSPIHSLDTLTAPTAFFQASPAAAGASWTEQPGSTPALVVKHRKPAAQRALLQLGAHCLSKLAYLLWWSRSFWKPAPWQARLLQLGPQ